MTHALYLPGLQSFPKSTLSFLHMTIKAFPYECFVPADALGVNPPRGFIFLTERVSANAGLMSVNVSDVFLSK